MIAMLVVIIVIFVDIMLEDADAPVIGSADSGTYRGGVAPGSNHSGRRDLWYEDEVALGVGRH